MIISKEELGRITSAACATPHDYLGMHKCKGGVVCRAYLINAKSCSLIELKTGAILPMEKLDKSGFFEIFLKGKRKVFAYMFRVESYYGDWLFPAGMNVCAKTGTGEVGEGKAPNCWMVGFCDSVD